MAVQPVPSPTTFSPQLAQRPVGRGSARHEDLNDHQQQIAQRSLNAAESEDQSLAHTVAQKDSLGPGDQMLSELGLSGCR